LFEMWRVTPLIKRQEGISSVYISMFSPNHLLSSSIPGPLHTQRLDSPLENSWGPGCTWTGDFHWLRRVFAASREKALLWERMRHWI
jgi:hypothetical protein